MRTFALIFGVTALLTSAALGAEYYKLSSVRRIDANLYRSGSLLIETRYCYHYTYGEDAILKYEGVIGSAIVWEDNSSCDVAKLVTER